MRRVKIGRVVRLFVAVAALYLLGMGCLLGRLTFPTQREYVNRAKGYVPVVQAIYDYREDHGAMPASLQDLVPGYLAWAPDAREVWYNGGNALTIRAHAPHTEIAYRFDSPNEGWSSGGDWGFGPMPLPKLQATNHARERQPQFRRKQQHSNDRLLARLRGQGQEVAAIPFYVNFQPQVTVGVSAVR